jgi:tricorn protease
MLRKLFPATLLVGLLIGMISGRAEEARLLRFPTLHGGNITFGYAGDLYTVPAGGGVARRLTSHVGYEMFPRYSPDGKWLAFTAQYDGNTEVYVMQAEGGEPRRLTWTATLDRDEVSDRMGPNNIVMGWRDAETVVFRTRARQWNPFKGELWQVKVGGGSPEVLPVSRGAWCSFSADGRQMIYNRVFREFRTWKRYRGGQADDLWLHDFNTGLSRALTSDPAQDIFPMWRGDQVYFVSERDEAHQANLWVQDVAGGQARQVTRFTDFAVKFPTLGDNGIVFENGGWIHRLDFASGQVSRVAIEIREDSAIGRDSLRDVSKETAGYDVSPEGNRMVVAARGDLFTLPARNGPTRPLTRTPGIHERDPAWSPDGRWIAYISDASGEDEVWIRPQDGVGEARQLTRDADTYKYGVAWSPDSTKLAWSDKKNRLQYVGLTNATVTVVAQSDAWEIRQFTWSPDSRWIALVLPEPRRFARIQLYSVDTAELVPATDGWFDVGSPEFSSDGKYLFFTSERSFNPTYGSTEWNHVYNDMTRIYLLTLARDTKSPLAPKSDEAKPVEPRVDAPPDVAAGEPAAAPAEAPKADESRTAVKAAGGKDASKVVVKVDREGLPGRVAVLPPGPSGYGGLVSVGDRLYYRKKGKLHVYDLDKEKETELGDVEGYVLTADRKKMLVKSGGGFAIVDAPTGKLDLGEKRISLGDLKVDLDRTAEWTQIFTESWRQMRDFFWDPKLHQVDWAAMRQRYEPLIAHVRHRADLSYVIGEMIGELNAGHAYVGGGDLPKVERIPMGLLGAQFERHSTGAYRVTRILPGHNWEPRYRSPLTEIGVDVKVGDYILAINGLVLGGFPDIQAALVGQAGKQVRLRVNSEPVDTGAREETVIPTADEQPLHYLDWVLGNIAAVEKATDGRVGYVHVPDMGVPGLNEFAKFYYPQLHKEALIVDCRGNGGGNVSPMIIERLRREPAMWTVARNGSVNVDPSGQVLGPKVLLLDQFSASDGDIVAYRFRRHGLGPIIGQRSWGGVVGIRGSLPFLDGGSLNRPEFSRFDLEATDWIMEGTGVEPDITVVNDPGREFAGIDDQLQRAIGEIRQKMAAQPVRVPAPPAAPDKRR